MQRRNFLHGLFGIAAAAAVAPLAKFIPAPAPIPAPVKATVTATIGQYADYINISDLAMQTDLPWELESRAAFTLNSIVRTTLDAAYGANANPSVGKQLARYKRDMRRGRYFAKQRRRSARMAA